MTRIDLAAGFLAKAVRRPCALRAGGIGAARLPGASQ